MKSLILSLLGTLLLSGCIIAPIPPLVPVVVEGPEVYYGWYGGYYGPYYYGPAGVIVFGVPHGWHGHYNYHPHSGGFHGHR